MCLDCHRMTSRAEEIVFFLPTALNPHLAPQSAPVREAGSLGHSDHGEPGVEISQVPGRAEATPRSPELSGAWGTRREMMRTHCTWRKEKAGELEVCNV